MVLVRVQEAEAELADPAVGRRVVSRDELSQHWDGFLRQVSLRQLEFGTTQTLTRLCGTLMELSDRYGHSVGANVEVTIPLSQQELAELSGMSREALVKGLHQLRSLGWLSVDERTIVLHDATAIRTRARLG